MSEREFRQWDIWRADLEEVFGHEQGDARPCLIVSGDDYNEHEMVVIIPLTDGGKKGRSARLHEIPLPVGTVEPGVESWALPHQVRTISTIRFEKEKFRFYGRLEDEASRERIRMELSDLMVLWETEDDAEGDEGIAGDSAA